MRRWLSVSALIAGAAFAGCSRTALLTLGNEGSGGGPSSAGVGGFVASGGSPMTGGSNATGGTQATGGTEATGGTGEVGGSGGTGLIDSGPGGAGTGGRPYADASPDAPWEYGNDPWGLCVWQNCFGDVTGYFVMRALYDSCACRRFCAQYCVTDGSDLCLDTTYQPPEEYQRPCEFCEVATTLMDVCSSDGEFSQAAPDFLRCLGNCGTPPPNAPLPHGTLCPRDGGGSPVFGGDCCPASAPTPHTDCSPQAATCLYGTTACSCGTSSDYPHQWVCHGYDAYPPPG